MNANALIYEHRPTSLIVMAIACALLAPKVHAASNDVTVSIAVSTAGLDLTSATGGKLLYQRIRVAARTVCGHGNRVDLVPAADFGSCYEKALGQAVRALNKPQLTLAYLGSHTLAQAEKNGITAPAQVAAQ